MRKELLNILTQKQKYLSLLAEEYKVNPIKGHHREMRSFFPSRGWLLKTVVAVTEDGLIVVILP